VPDIIDKQMHNRSSKAGPVGQASLQRSKDFPTVGA
jgi:hypothetical protein